SSPELSQSSDYDLTCDGLDGMCGFYPVEDHAGRRFRWSEPACLITVSIPRNSRRLEIELLALRPPERPYRVSAYLDGYELRASARDEDDGVLAFDLGQHAFTANGKHRLVL